jgi:molybdenum cofactor cytidylyltransferase
MGSASKPKIGAVLLAAGAGRRLGGVAKALIRINGLSLAQRHLLALREAGVDTVVVVTGFEREAVEAEARGLETALAYNPGYAQGLAGSVRIGLAALSHGMDGQGFAGILMALVDQPLIEASDLAALIAAFARRAGGHVLVPMVDGRRGNPVMLDEWVRARVLASAPPLAVRELIDREPALVHTWQTDNARFVTDLDTREDLERLAALTGWRIELPPPGAATPA